MEIFLGVILFIMGTFFGSFFTLAVYRIPLKKDITHEHSFCPNCNHKLGMLDLFPVWSYLFLRGKCRYCGEKIRIRYFLLEILSGLVFVTMYLILNIHGNFFDVNNLEFFLSFIFQYVTLVIVAGIDKEHRKINSSVLLFGTISQVLYMLYLYIVKNINIHRYVIYLVMFILLFVMNKWGKKENYGWQLMMLGSYILFALGAKALGLIAILTLVWGLLKMVGNKKYGKKIQEIPCGYMIGISTIVYQIVEKLVENYYFI